jgi:hypothetical protein
MLIDVSQLLGSKVPPISTIPGVEARGIKYVDFSDLVVPDITYCKLKPSGEINSCSPPRTTDIHSLMFGEYTMMVCPRMGYTFVSSTPKRDRAPMLDVLSTTASLGIVVKLTKTGCVDYCTTFSS